MTSPTKLTDQKPFRGFDITSLIRKDDDDFKPKRLAASPPASSPGSPNVSVGPPMSPPSNPYANLFNSGLYQQYLGHLIANSAAGGGGGGGPPPINPMLLQAQLAMAAQSNHAHLLANYNGSASSLISERLKQNRFSPYTPTASLPNSLSHPSLISPPGLGSAFKSLSRPLSGNSPPVSPPHSSGSPPPARSPGSVGSPATVKSEPEPEPSSAGTAVAASDIKNIEKMINGLSGNAEGSRFSLSHEKIS